MNRKKKVARNIFILIILSIIIFTRVLYLTPIAAHEASERSLHYGPSKVVHVEDFDGGKFILSKYDKWISCDTVNRSKSFFWYFGSRKTVENEQNKPLDYGWGMDDRYGTMLYGVINDDRISKVELQLEGGSTLSQTDFYDGDMFLFIWENDFTQIWLNSIKAYDALGNLILEEEIK